MRFGVVVLIALSCVACAPFQKPVAEASAPPPAAVADKSAPVADVVTPTRFECSDGTISTSQDACLVSMARARLPPSQSGGRMPANPGSATGDAPTGSIR
jgi:hypothetical protein